MTTENIRIDIEQIFKPVNWDDASISLSVKDARALRRLPYSDAKIRLLLHGPFGVGKTELARYLARCITCKRATHPLGDPCGTCSACNAKWNSRWNVDNEVKEIDCARGTVSEVMDRIESARLYNPVFPISGFNGSIIILDEIHRNNGILTDRLLKLIEDTWEVYILVTAQPDDLGEALIQRCIDIKLSNPNQTKCESWLMLLCQRAGIQASPGVISRMVKNCGCIPRLIRNETIRSIRTTPDGIHTIDPEDEKN